MAGGVDVVQIRERDLDARTLATLVRHAISVRAQSATRIVINDRLDVALAVGADGVHLREDSLGIAAARQLVRPKFLIGRSVHASTSAAPARIADYLIAGSVFATPSKAGHPASLGVDGLRQVVRAAGECPVWAVGGLTAERSRAVVESGAKGVAAIGAFLPTAPTRDVAGEVQRLTEGMRFSFDRPVELP